MFIAPCSVLQGGPKKTAQS